MSQTILTIDNLIILDEHEQRQVVQLLKLGDVIIKNHKGSKGYPDGGFSVEVRLINPFKGSCSAASKNWAEVSSTAGAAMHLLLKEFEPLLQKPEPRYRKPLGER